MYRFVVAGYTMFVPLVEGSAHRWTDVAVEHMGSCGCDTRFIYILDFPPPPPLDEDIFHARSSRSPPATLFGQHRPDRICPVLPAKVGIVHASMCMVCVCVMSLGRATVSPNHFSFHSLYIFIFTWIDRWHCTPPLQNIAVHV